VIYGALPPEVRRREAERFATGPDHILVATDAIGMGLNLPIRRVLFSTLTKFDGEGDRTLDESEVHQIAGRAGRYGIHEEGFRRRAGRGRTQRLRTLKELLPLQPRAPRDFKAPVAPELVARRDHRRQAGQAQAARGAGRVRRAADAGRRPLRGGRAGADAGDLPPTWTSAPHR
jgi:superfamily II DNA/RNA helicase